MKIISLLALVLAIMFVAGCAAKAPDSTTTTIANKTTTLPPTTTTTLPEFELLATGVSAFYLDTDSIYFMTNDATTGKLMKAPKDGKSKAEIAKDFGGASVKNLAADANYIYFTHELINGIGKFVRVSKTDSTADEIYSCNPNTAGNVFSDETHVYLLPSKGTFCRMKKPSMASDGNFRFSLTSGGPNMVQDATAFYFSDSSWIKKISKAKTELSSLVSEPAQSNLILDEANIFWVNSAGNLNRIATAAGSKSALLLSGVKSKDIASDGKSIFISNQASIDALVKIGGNPTVFTKTSAAAEKLFVDAGYLYWIEAGNLKRKKI